MSRTIERTIEIEAPPARIWEVLTDFRAHSEWNPFIRSISGRAAVGARLDLQVTPKGGRTMRFRPIVTAAAPEKSFAWFGTLGMRGIFDGAHSFVLKDLGGGRTSITQSETFTGALVPFFGKGLVKTGAGFDDMNQALKLRCEATNG
jgi:hypothetical protein